jgi:DNA polymerase-3 subunit gamma/tau
MLSLSGAAGGAKQQTVPQVAQTTSAASAATGGVAAQTKQTLTANAPAGSQAVAMQPNPVQASTVRPSVTQTRTAQPNALQPNALQPNAAQPSASKPSPALATSAASPESPPAARITVATAALAASPPSADSDADSEPSYLDHEPEYFSGNDIDYGSEPVFDQADDAQFAQAPAAPVSDTIILPEPWAAFSAKLPLSGMAAQLARQSEWVAVSGRAMTLRVASKALAVGAHADRLRAVLNEYFGFVVQVHFEIGAAQGQSAHAVDLAALAARQRAAEHSVTIDPFVQALMKDFGAHVVPGSIRPGHASQ